jgi:hypothetical protein
MFFLGEIEHRFGSSDSFSRYYRVIAQSKESAWRILDKLAAEGSIGPYPAMFPVKGSYVGDTGQIVIVDAIIEMDAVVFNSKALERFPLHADGGGSSSDAPEDFPAYVKEVARRLGRSLVIREANVEQSVLIHAIAASIGETDWQKLRTKFAGVKEPVQSSAAQLSSEGTEALPDADAALAQDNSQLQPSEASTDASRLPRRWRRNPQERGQRPESELRRMERAVKEHAASVGPSDLTVTIRDSRWKPDGMFSGWLCERTGRPTFVFSSNESGSSTGIGRTVPGFDLTVAIEVVRAAIPQIFDRVEGNFGGHFDAMSVTIVEGQVGTFAKAFEQVARNMWDRRHLG